MSEFDPRQHPGYAALHPKHKHCPGCPDATIFVLDHACTTCWLLLPQDVRNRVKLAGVYHGQHSAEYSDAIEEAKGIWRGVRA